eukprot:7214574-Alexandrium_andersonii.AAC.1
MGSTNAKSSFDTLALRSRLCITAPPTAADPCLHANVCTRPVCGSPLAGRPPPWQKHPAPANALGALGWHL